MNELEKIGLTEFEENFEGIKFKSYASKLQVEYYGESSNIKKMIIEQVLDVGGYIIDYYKPEDEKKGYINATREFRMNQIPKELNNKYNNDMQYRMEDGRFNLIMD